MAPNLPEADDSDPLRTGLLFRLSAARSAKRTTSIQTTPSLPIRTKFERRVQSSPPNSSTLGSLPSLPASSLKQLVESNPVPLAVRAAQAALRAVQRASCVPSGDAVPTRMVSAAELVYRGAVDSDGRAPRQEASVGLDMDLTARCLSPNPSNGKEDAAVQHALCGPSRDAVPTRMVSAAELVYRGATDSDGRPPRQEASVGLDTDLTARCLFPEFSNEEEPEAEESMGISPAIEPDQNVSNAPLKVEKGGFFTADNPEMEGSTIDDAVPEGSAVGVVVEATPAAIACASPDGTEDAEINGGFHEVNSPSMVIGAHPISCEPDGEGDLQRVDCEPQDCDHDGMALESGFTAQPDQAAVAESTISAGIRQDNLQCVKLEFNSAQVLEARRKKRKARASMREVLCLQKSLETAGWTDSVAVQEQSEVIIISDDEGPSTAAKASRRSSAMAKERAAWVERARKGAKTKARFSEYGASVIDVSRQRQKTALMGSKNCADVVDGKTTGNDPTEASGVVTRSGALPDIHAGPISRPRRTSAGVRAGDMNVKTEMANQKITVPLAKRPRAVACNNETRTSQAKAPGRAVHRKVRTQEALKLRAPVAAVPVDTLNSTGKQTLGARSSVKRALSTERSAATLQRKSQRKSVVGEKRKGGVKPIDLPNRDKKSSLVTDASRKGEGEKTWDRTSKTIVVKQVRKKSVMRHGGQTSDQELTESSGLSNEDVRNVARKYQW